MHLHNHKIEPQMFPILIHIEYRQNHLRYMYISLALGLIANSKQRQRQVECRLNSPKEIW